jgi:hypothetical protein
MVRYEAKEDEMNGFTISEKDSNYSEIPTGFIEDISFAEFISKYDLEVVDANTIRSEWGNGEGYDTFSVEFAS